MRGTSSALPPPPAVIAKETYVISHGIFLHSPSLWTGTLPWLVVRLYLTERLEWTNFTFWINSSTVLFSHDISYFNFVLVLHNSKVWGFDLYSWKDVKTVNVHMTFAKLYTSYLVMWWRNTISWAYWYFSHMLRINVVVRLVSWRGAGEILEVSLR